MTNIVDAVYLAGFIGHKDHNAIEFRPDNQYQ